MAPKTTFDQWDGEKWVINIEAQYADTMLQAERKRANLLIIANNTIAPLQDSVDLGIATDEELISLKEWKMYRVELIRWNSKNSQDDLPRKPD